MNQIKLIKIIETCSDRDQDNSTLKVIPFTDRAKLNDSEMGATDRKDLL
jgi:hypothetical protein